MPTPSVEKNEEWRVPGMALVSGVAIGKAFFLGTSPLQIRELTLPQEEVEHEIHRYYKALNRSKSDIVALEKEAQGKQGQQEISSILQAHLEIIKDPILTEEVVNTIRKDRKNAEYVFSSVMGKIEESLTAVQGTPLAVDRVQDIHDISNRVIGHLCCQYKSSLGDAGQNIIVFSKELTPSEVASANPSYIRGFVSLVGAPTSHTAIVSRAKNIPYLANFSQENWERIQEYSGRLVLIDGIRGEIIFNPKSKTLESCYKQKSSSYRVKSYPQATPHATVSSHAASLEELRMLSEFFPQTSIGLFRSEFLAIAEDRLPSVEEQEGVYKSLALFSDEKASVLRLFDFGEDKPCPGLDPIKERSIRYLLKSSLMLDDQLRAILTASASGPLKVLIPGTADVVEIIEVKRRLENIRRSFNKDHVIENIAWGSMIETPAAVLMIDEILQECDFISIGTNDLMQYTLGNNREAVLPRYLGNPLHPSVMRMIHHVISQAKQRNVHASICGEAAANLSLTPFFLGLGVQELAVAMPAIVELRERIASLNLNDCVEHTEKLLRARTCEEVQVLLT
ncbi:phosphoenolpyruvate--protein phosphotransferase [Chlamydia felis]